MALAAGVLHSCLVRMTVCLADWNSRWVKDMSRRFVCSDTETWSETSRPALGYANFSSSTLVHAFIRPGLPGET